MTVEPEVLKQARIEANREGTSVNKVLSRYLETFAHGTGNAQREPDSDTSDQTAGQDAAFTVPPTPDDEAMLEARGEAIDRLFDAPRTPPSEDAPEGRGWTREEIYDRPIIRLDR